MTLPLQYDRIHWNDPELLEALKRYRETIDASSPLVNRIERAFTAEERVARQRAYFALLEKYRV